jgi:hypothetical protein
MHAMPVFAAAQQFHATIATDVQMIPARRR